MGMAAWFVPLTTVLDAHGMEAIRPIAFASTAVAALVSPLLFGAVADRHVPPTRVLRWLALASSICLGGVAMALNRRAPSGLVLAVIQCLALASVPTWSLCNVIVLGRLKDPRREFGPIRAFGTLGWMVGCWLVSLLGADASTHSMWVGMGCLLALSLFTLRLPAIAPPSVMGTLTVRQRLGLDALSLLRNPDHRVVFLTAAFIAAPLSAFYPYTPPHLRDLGLTRTTAWMSLGQVTEIVAMFGLAALLARWRLKWIFACGLGFALARYVLFAANERGWVLLGVSLHGLALTLFFITAPIYLNERVDVLWRARAQALLSLMTSGFGNLLGYLGIGVLFAACQGEGGARWPIFWGVLAALVGAGFAYFLAAYRGRAAQ